MCPLTLCQVEALEKFERSAASKQRRVSAAVRSFQSAAAQAAVSKTAFKQKVSECMYVCMFVCICMYMYVLCVCVCVCVCVYLYMYVCMYMYICNCMNMFLQGARMQSLWNAAEDDAAAPPSGDVPQAHILKSHLYSGVL